MFHGPLTQQSLWGAQLNTLRTSRRIASTLVALTLGGTGLTVAAAPAAYASDTSMVAKLPISSYSTMAVDSVHERIFISNRSEYSNRDGVVLVYNFQGERLASLPSTYMASGIALSHDSKTLYVSESYQIVKYDTETLAKTVEANVDLGEGCDRQAAFAGGKIWYTHLPYDYYKTCDNGVRSLHGTANGWAVNTNWSAAGRLQLASRSEVPDQLVMAQPKLADAPDPFLTTFDAGGTTLVRGPSRRFADGEGKGAMDMKDVAQTPDGKRIAVADAAYGTRLLEAGDLSDAATGYQPLPTGATSSAVAFSGDGKYIARGAAAAGSTADLLVQPADPANGTASPLEFAFEGELDGSRVAPRGLGWSQDGARLFAMTTNAAGSEYWLHIIQPPAAQYDSRFTGGLTHTPGQPVVGEPVGIRGRLELDGAAPAEPVKVTAVRKDASGTRLLAQAEVDADGTFTVLDVPAQVGEATYTVSFLGDLTHRPAQDLSLTVDVAKAPTAVALTAPEEATLSGGVEITGKLTGQGKPLPSGVSLSVTRTDRLGTGTLSSVTVAADGTFRINDIPRTTRSVTYTVSYAGDAVHEGSTASATVLVRR